MSLANKKGTEDRWFLDFHSDAFFFRLVGWRAGGLAGMYMLMLGITV